MWIVNRLQGFIQSGHEPCEQSVIYSFRQRIPCINRKFSVQRGNDHVTVGVYGAICKGARQLLYVATQ